jgi:flagellar biosynthetic protein FlhB
MQMARKRMMQSVPDADVVITNPTHLAVALKYEPAQMGAPKVVAKGAGAIAARIREIANQHQVPIVENKPLARSLYKSVEIDEEVPGTLYQAVAEVLAYVYGLKSKPAGKAAGA